MYRLWIIFAQAATVAVAVVFVVSTFRPEWLPVRSAPGTTGALVQQAPTAGPLPTETDQLEPPTKATNAGA